MKYTGRITCVIITLLAVLVVRLYAYIFLNYSLTNPPIFCIVLSFITFWVGKQYDKVKFCSERDSLTGFYNRRFIDQVIPSLLAQMDRKNGRLSIAILDCDNFKSINDKYGHKKGDLVLQEFSTLLSRSVRTSDIVARWGGDEFLIITPYAAEEDIKVIFNRFNSKLQELSKRLQMPISVSSGYAIYPNDAATIDNLINIADGKMYGEKKKARYC